MTTDGTDRKHNEERLDREIGRLPRVIEPPRDLWPAIEAALDEEPEGVPYTGPSVWRWAGLAAAVAAGVMLPFLLREAPTADDAPALATVPPPTERAAPELRLRNAATTSISPGPEYEAARDELLGLLERRLTTLEPEEREIVVRNIEAIRSALEQIDSAMQDNPDDPLLQELLLKTYQTELDVMARVNGLAGPARRRTDL